VRDGPADHWRTMLLVVKPASQRKHWRGASIGGAAVDGEYHRLSSAIGRELGMAC
jgi:hypothetical protein